MTTPTYYQYWGKAANGGNSGPPFHLLPYHCLDVAAVGAALLRNDRFGLEGLAEGSGLTSAQLEALAIFFLGIHDLGKFARGFQNLAAFDGSALVTPNPRFRYGNGVRHDTLGWIAWKSRVRHLIPGDTLPSPKSAAWLMWFRATAGHHGAPPQEMDGTLPIDPSLYFHEEDIAAAAHFVTDMAELLLPAAIEEPPPQFKRTLIHASWKLAGLAVLADWIGSNQTYFPYASEPMPLAQYWHHHARPQAERALQGIGIGRAGVIAFTSGQRLFDYVNSPTPLQRHAASVPIAPGPQLFLLEDVTGAGKTEAALILTHRLMASGRARGLYFGLPTMATSNQMYRRVGEVYRRFFLPDTAPSLVLAHGARNLVEDFRDSILPEQPQDQDYQAGEGSASALCTAWLADSNKKALLADVGVGTLDQALLAALPARHQSLRLLGLRGKVLVADEVHAYDDYTGRLLQVLLEQHARQGGSAILLSATLPASLRSTLIASFQRGLGVAGQTAEVEMAPYPLVTQAHLEGITRTGIETRAEVRRRVKVRFVHEEAEVIACIRAAVAAGRCVAWIRNTIDDAREAREALRLADWIDPSQLTLFHSRYALADRLKIENHVLDVLGKTSGHDVRKGQVIVSSQVIEQSVDCDADLMISDLAPIDLLIQRAGRLHRHSRDAHGNPASVEGRGEPELVILAPKFTEEPTANWHSRPFPRAARVYPDSGRLWLTQRVLAETGAIVMPEGARSLIEAVYGEDAEMQIPAELLEASLKQQGEAISERTLANANALDFSRGYCQEAGRWDREEEKPTRLGDEDREFVLALAGDDGLQPWAHDHPYPWAASVVKVPARRLDRLAAEWLARFGSDIEALKAKHRFLKYAEILPLQWDGNQAYADGLNLRGERVLVRYDVVVGVTMMRANR
jgi:CRISPR-associated endonuclease/helicase Cas3